jgi:hypothetical protein
MFKQDSEEEEEDLSPVKKLKLDENEKEDNIKNISGKYPQLCLDTEQVS